MEEEKYILDAEKNISESYFDKIPKWKKYMLFFILGLGGIITIAIYNRFKEKKYKEKKLREKVRYFKPTVNESMFSRSISWEMRDTPLTDKQLDDFMKSQKYT